MQIKISNAHQINLNREFQVQCYLDFPESFNIFFLISRSISREGTNTTNINSTLIILYSQTRNYISLSRSLSNSSSLSQQRDQLSFLVQGCSCCETLDKNIIHKGPKQTHSFFIFIYESKCDQEDYSLFKGSRSYCRSHRCGSRQ